jgi:prolyl oligopeptidase PreP (S9A serine peptidase family)
MLHNIDIYENSAHYVKICYMLLDKIRMTKMYDERKWIVMYGNKKSYLMLYFLHKYRIPPTPM